MSGEVQSGSPWVAGPLPTVGDGWVQLSPDSKKIFWDELSPADQEQIIQYMLSAQIPMLTPPQDVQASSSDTVVAVMGKAQIAAEISEYQHEIISQMLDGWLKSIQEQAERSRREDEERAIKGLSEAFHTYQHEVNLKTDPNFPLLATGLIILGTGIFQTSLPVTNTSGLEFNPIVEMSSHALSPFAGEMRAVELGMIGALYSAGIQYFTIAQVTSDTVNGKKLNDGEFAKGYADNVVKLIGDPNFNNYIMAIVTRGIPRGESLSEERILELTSMVRIILLSSALAMLYKAEAGKMTSLEFAGMLNGEITFANGDIRATIIALIKGQLQNISPSLRAKFLNSLFEYFDTDPALEALGDPAKVFSGIYGTLPRGDLEA